MSGPKIAPDYLSIGRLFQSNFIFSVPKYQRGYAWGDTEVEDFLNDLWKCYDARLGSTERHHLFGGVVSAEGPSPGSARRLCEVIDGQQRLATFVIFVNHLVSAYEKLASGATSSSNAANKTLAESRARWLKEKYLEYEHEINREPVTVDRFEFSNRDQQFFKDLVAGSSPTAIRDSHIRLRDAFQQIGDRLTLLVDKQGTLAKKLDALRRLEMVLDEDCTVIHIVTDSREEAYRLFQVLNDRGISLTEGDLLRARTLEMLGQPEFKEEQKTIETAWDQILIDPPEFTRKFLMWFYASIIGDRPLKTSLFDNFLDQIFPQHAKVKLSKTDVKRIVATVRQMQAEVILCRKLREGEWPFPHASPITQWDRQQLDLLMNSLEHELCMPLLLAAAHRLDHKKFSQIVLLVERFAFRYKNISNQHVNSLMKIYHDHSVAIRNDPTGYRLATLRKDLRELQDRKVPDSIFGPALKNVLTFSRNTGNKTLRYFLVSAEYYLDWYDGGASGEPKCRDKMRVFDFSNTTIEHVYPLEPTVRNKALDPHVNRLGNLTFLAPGDNDTAGNKSFDLKKPLFAASSVKMNQQIAKETLWDKAAIKTREDKLLDLALKVFTA